MEGSERNCTLDSCVVAQPDHSWGTSLGLMAMLVAGVASAVGSVADAVIAFLLDVGSAIIDGIALATPTPECPNGPEDWAVMLMDGASAVIDRGVVAPYTGHPVPW